MTKTERLLLFAVALFLFALSTFAGETWIRHLVLDHDGIFHVYWTPKENKIVFKVEVAANGYVGFGLSPHGGMTGSDIVTGWIIDGKAYFQDRHGIGNTFPPMDMRQDWFLTSGWENDTHTSLTFYRDLITCDPDDMDIDDNTVRLIYAYSHKDPISEDLLQYHHSNRGTRSTFLLQGKINRLKNTEKTPYWDVKAPNFTVTSRDRSVYWNAIFKSPQLNVKHHIVQVEPLIQPKNERYVHHMAIYECIGGMPEELEGYVNHPGYQYSNTLLPESLYKCETLFVLRCVGGNGIFLPENAGFPLPANIPKYYRLEIHYDNPLLHDNIRDQSGFRMHYTAKLRKHDAGVLSVSANPTPTLFIPPRLDDFLVATHSNEECFGKKMPPEGIKIWAAEVHAHQIARRIRARHFRGNEEFPPIADDRNYDFNYQDFKYLEKEAQVLPSDQITVECFYNSSGRSEITFGGATSTDEMCVVHFLYYPRIDVDHSFTGPLLPIIANLTGATVQALRNASEVSNSTILSVLGEHLKAIDWKAMNISSVQETMRYAQQEVMCVPGNDQMEKSVEYPKNLVPYEEPDKCSKNSMKKRKYHDLKMRNFI